MTVNIIKSYISKEDCQLYIDFLEPKATLTERTGIFNAIGYPTSLVASQVNGETGALYGDSDPTNKKLGALFIDIRTAAEEFFGSEIDLCNANYQVLPPGTSNPMHSDTTKLDGSPISKDGTVEEVEWSGLLYLNTCGEDFEGGTLYFPEFDLDYVPQAGDLVVFRGDLEHRHEVKKVLSGHRKNLVFFWGKRGNVSEENRFDVDYT
jgi:predicted 2-oxoglutarate/Fe(II)-dependent dioxygenase YbiX